LALEPIGRSDGAELLHEVGNGIRPLVEKVGGERMQSSLVVGFYAPVTASDTIPAQHHQIRLHVVSALEDVMER